MTPREQAMTKVRGLAKVSNEMDQTDKLYSAFKNAETRGLEGSDAFIRTKANLGPGGSSAYGPVQITGTLVQDMMDRGVIPDDLKDYSNRFLDQSKLFLKYGNEKELEGYDPKYGARPLSRIIQEHIKKPLAEELLFGKLSKGGAVLVKVKDGKIAFGFPKGSNPPVKRNKGTEPALIK